MSDSKINMVAPPDGVTGEGFFATKLNDVVGLARANSLWPLPFATSCCGIEFMATMASHYDLARFGMERVSFSPRQADMLLVMGTISKKNGPYFTSSIRANERAKMGNCCRGMRYIRWSF